MIDPKFEINASCTVQFVEVSKTNFPGHLRYTHQNGGIITLTSKSFNKILDKRELKLLYNFKILVGILDNGKKFTVINPFLIRRTDSNGIFRLTFKFDHIITGSKFSSLDSIVSKKIEFKISGLKQYLNSTTIERNRNNDTIEISSTLPTGFDVNVNNDLTIHFKWSHHFNSNIEHLQSSIKKDVSIVIESTKNLPLLDFISISERIEVFFSLLFYQKVVSYEFIGKFFLTTKCHVYTKQDELETRLENTRHLDYLLPFKDFEKHFPSMLTNYLENFDNLKFIYLLAYENIGISGKFSNNQFLNVAQALEAFHRTIHDKTRIDKKDFKALLKRIKSTLIKDDYLFIKSELDFANSYRLKGRLDDLRQIYRGDFLDTIGFDEDFCDKIRNTRNALTHITDNKKIFKNSEIIYATIIANTALVFFLIQQLGVDHQDSDKSMVSFWQSRFYFIK